MGNCKDCRHWTPPGTPISLASQRTNYEGFGECERTGVEGGAGGQGRLALAYDDAGVFAILATKPEFGCVQFEAKEDVRPGPPERLPGESAAVHAAKTYDWIMAESRRETDKRLAAIAWPVRQKKEDAGG